ncbi:MAG: hypothetical protein AAFX93_14125 [Verrucomicrobiota bacterium]
MNKLTKNPATVGSLSGLAGFALGLFSGDFSNDVTGKIIFGLVVCFIIGAVSWVTVQNNKNNP